MTSSTRQLVENVPQTGRLAAICVRPARREPVRLLDRVEALAGLGLDGDHRLVGRDADPASKRQVTLIQTEHLRTLTELVGSPVELGDTRRNLAVSGINLASLRDRRFRIGDVVLEASGPCHPCSRMEESLGVGGFQAMRGHGGLTARIISGGTLVVGADVTVMPSRAVEG